MLHSLAIKNFTVFSDSLFEFSPGLNVIIGENGTGKSHLLKLAYSVAYVRHEMGRHQDNDPGVLFFSGMSKSVIQRRIAEKLIGVFKPDTLGRLCRRGRGRARAELEANFGDRDSLKFSFATNSSKDVSLILRPLDHRFDPPIFFPAKEALSLYPGFTNLYEQREIVIDETYYDLCKRLSVPLLKGKRAYEIANLIRPLEEVMGGSVRLDAGRFYLSLPGQGTMEISLVAEGFRKIAMLAYLAANGSLNEKGVLFWDEPETNLNPRIMAKVAATLLRMADGGVQVVVATHCLFMMKELSLLAESSMQKNQARFFALSLGENGVEVEDGAVLEDLKTIVSLEEVLAQDDREQEHFYGGRL